MDYLTLKLIHVVSSTILFGTGIGSAFYLLVASLGRDPPVVAFASRRVVLADWLFTTPAAIIQPLTGVWLVRMAGYPWSSTWLWWSVVLYAVAIACWLPVVWIQVRMARLAQRAADCEQALPAAYWRHLVLWTALGFVAFFAFLIIFYLMVVKPV